MEKDITAIQSKGGSLKPYRHYREYTNKEISSEQDEYFDNDKIQKVIPKMFKDGDDVTYRFKDAKLELLDLEELKNLHNSDTSEILGYSNKLDKLKHVVKLAQSYGKDYKSLLNAFKNNYKLPPPLVIRDTKDQLYLMAGNTRMMMALALGYNMPVKIAKYKKEFVLEAQKLNKNQMIEIGKWIIAQHNLKSKFQLSRSSTTRGNYLWNEDVIRVASNPKNLLDFVETVLHECDHALDRKKMGARKYERLYTQSGQQAVDSGGDFHDDNEYEIKAEKYAQRNGKKWLRKLLDHIPDG